MTEDQIKIEMRLFALESIVCQHLAGYYKTKPRKLFDTIKQKAVGGTQQPIFEIDDPVLSDLFSAEFQVAVERLYGMIQHHLDR